MDQSSGRSPAVTDFIERLAVSLEREGLPRIAGRLVGFFLTHQGRLVSLEDLSAELRISRGSASTNTRLLEGMGIIDRVSVPGDRRVLYRTTEDPYGRVVAHSTARVRDRQRIVLETLDALPPDDASTRESLELMARFQSVVLEETGRLLARWREDRAGAST